MKPSNFPFILIGMILAVLAISVFMTILALHIVIKGVFIIVIIYIFYRIVKFFRYFK